MEYKAVVEATVVYDVKVEKTGEYTWGYSIELDGKPISAAGGIISEDWAVLYAKLAVEKLDDILKLITLIEVGEHDKE